MLQMLWDCGFRSPVHEMKVVSSIEGVIEHCAWFESQRDALPYEIDGLVIKVNDLKLQDKMGMTTHHPRWAIAYKFKARQATSTLRAVEFQVGRTGAVTPVAKLDAVPIGGVTVSSISIHNEDYIKEKDLMIGDTVLIERAGDVIPQIVRSQPELRTGTEQPISFPTTCPVCSSHLFKEEGEAVWRCVNVECPAQAVERIIHFVSKDAMDIRSFGEQQVRKFYDMGLLKDIPGLYELAFEKIGTMEGFGKKSISNLQASLEQSKQQPLHRLIYGLGIRHVGETMAKTLARAIQHIMDLKHKSVEELMQLEDIGPKVANSIVRFFANEQNVAMLQQLEALGLNMQQAASTIAADGMFTGKSFLFTGTLTQMKRQEAEAKVEAKGGQILGGVSSKLNYLVVGEDAGSKLEKAKKIASITILSEEDFLKLLHHD
jgi:DNA ligase (NAD+)